MKDLFDLRDDVAEIRAIAEFLEFTSNAIVSANLNNPDKLQIGLNCCFEYLDSRLETVEQGIEELMSAEKGSNEKQGKGGARS